MARGRNFAREAIERRVQAGQPPTGPGPGPDAPELFVRDLDIVPAQADATPAPASAPAPVPSPTLPPALQPPPPAPPEPDPKALEELERRRAEAERHRQEAEELRKELNAERIGREAELFRQQRQQEELARSRQELEAFRSQKDLEETARFTDEDFATLDANDARKLVQTAAALAEKKYRAEVDAIKNQLAYQNEQWGKYLQSSYQSYAEAQQDRMNREIRAAVPDLPRLTRDPEFVRYLASPVSPGATLTNQQIITQELAAGNAGYVIQAVGAFKAGRPRLEDIAQVDSASAGKTAAPEKESPFTGDTPDPLLELVRTNRISKAEFRERKKARAG
jgi:hypothetical protein